MDFTIPEELRMVQTTLRRFIDREVMPLEAQYKHLDELPEEVARPLKEKAKAHGLWALAAPREFGGGGLSVVGMCLAYEEIYKCAVARGLFGSSGFSMLYTASDYLKDRYLYPTIRGEKRGAIAFSEPGAAGDLAGLQTNATPKGDTYLLNGRKIWISFAHKADYLCVLARTKGTERHGGLTWFVVDKGMPGFQVARTIPMLGWATTGELLFDNCEVPAAHRVSAEGQAWGSAQRFLDANRIHFGAWSCGMAERCLKMAIHYSKQRVTFGEPLANRQAIQWMLVESAMELHASRLMTYHAAWKADQGQDVRQEAAMVKVFATEAASRVIDRALQIHGAAGYSTDLPIEKFYRDIRMTRIGEGANEIHRAMMAKRLLRTEATPQL